MMIQQVETFVQELMSEEDYRDCFIVDIAFHKSKNELKIYVDADEGITLDRCKRISRAIESYLDESQILGEKYALEVSSPGLDRPLTMWRQYMKNKGRDLIVTLYDENKTLEGKLIELHQDNTITLQCKVKKKEENIEIQLSDIKKALVKIKF